MLRHAVVAWAVLLVSSYAQAESQARSCCGPCVCVLCNGGPEEDAGKYLLAHSSELFFGTVVAEELLPCCDDRRADVTFKVIRRWKGAEAPQVVVRTQSCTEIYPFILGHSYLISTSAGDGEAKPPVLARCFQPLEAAAAHATMAKLDKDSLRFLVSVDKTAYVPGEPVIVRFSWANLTDADMSIVDWPGPGEGITELRRNYDDVLYDFVIQQHDGMLLEYKGPAT